MVMCGAVNELLDRTGIKPQQVGGYGQPPFLCCSASMQHLNQALAFLAFLASLPVCKLFPMSPITCGHTSCEPPILRPLPQPCRSCHHGCAPCMAGAATTLVGSGPIRPLRWACLCLLLAASRMAVLDTHTSPHMYCLCTCPALSCVLSQIDILVTCCSIYCPTPSLASMLVNK